MSNEYPTQEALLSSQGETPIINPPQTPILITSPPPIVQITIPPQPTHQSDPFMVGGNQILPSNVQSLHPNLIKLKSNPAIITCPRCGYSGLTRTTTNFNIANFLCCWCTGLLCWICFQCCRDKDINCNDANHFCAKCNAVLGTYSAC